MYSALFLFLIFYDFVEAYVPMANYWDEMAAFIVLCWGAFSFLRNRKMSKGEIVNWCFLLLLIVIGALGNIFHPGLQSESSVFVRDVVALSKFPAIFFVLQRRTISEEKQESIICSIAKISRWIVLVTLFAAIIGYFVDLGFYTGEIRILNCFQFVFSHPTFFVSSYVMIAAALIAESVSKNRVYLLIDCLLLFMTQRTKGYIFIAFVMLFVLLGEDRITKALTAIFGSGKEKVKLSRVILVAVAGVLIFLFVGKSRLEEHISMGLTIPRTVLHIVGIRILIDFFPLGSGFGTFASHLSGRHYSNLYELYGISEVIGMTRTDYSFIADTFWPYIYGQFGIFGLLIYVKLIFGIFFRQYRAKLTNASRLAMVAVWIYALIASTSEAYFTNGTGVQMALFLTVFIGYSGAETGQMDVPEEKK